MNINIQKNAEIMEEFLAKETDEAYPSYLSAREYIALTDLLAELENLKLYTMPEGIN